MIAQVITKRADWRESWLIYEWWLISALDYMVWSQASEAISESPCQFIQAGHINLYLWRTQEASCSLSLHVFLLAQCSCTHSPLLIHKHLDLFQQTKERAQSSIVATNCRDPVLVIVQTYLLFPPFLPLVLRVLQHLLSPQVKEVRRIGVELQALLPIVPAEGEKTPRDLVSFWLACWGK